ncbi:hypothetical protein AAE478_001456 [Parahypoxylon ruwenzoriense]
MDKQLDTCFDRVEKALGSLVDSIAKYHPSVAQVNDLGLADIELNKGLEELQTHQSNYRRIQDLRAATTSLDTQIKDTLRLLANTRRELVGASATSFPDDRPGYGIRYDELLAYARRISKTTLPPAGALNAPSNNDVKVENGGVGSASTETAATTPAGGTPNGTATPANGIQVQPQQQQTPLDPSVSQQTIGTTTDTSLPEPLQTHLNPNAHLEFIPWPSEEQVRKGAIASLSYLSETGIDPEGYDPEAEKQRREREQEEERQRQDREEQEKQDRARAQQAQMQQAARIRAEKEREREAVQSEAWRRASVTGVVAEAGPGAGGGAGSTSTSPTGEKRQFQFMGDDDDDDDD